MDGRRSSEAMSELQKNLIIAWGCYWVFGLVSLYPVWNGIVAIQRIALPILESMSALLLWKLCELLTKRGWPRNLEMVATVLSAYVLGYGCSVIANFTNPQTWTSRLWRKGAIIAGSVIASFQAFPLIIVVAVFFVILQYKELREKEQSRARAEEAAREAEMRALRYELTPHFLFNSLDGIGLLVREGNTQAARRMIARVGNFLRSTLSDAAVERVPLALEVRHALNYLAIEQVRLGERLSITHYIDQSVSQLAVPPLLLQPLVENAVRHGVAPSPAAGKVEISARYSGEAIVISVTNTVPAGFSTECRGHGTGLQNTQKTLARAFAGHSSMTIEDSHPGSWTVVLKIFGKEPGQQ